MYKKFKQNNIMKFLPKEFVLTDFTIEQGNEVTKHSRVNVEIKSEWKYLIVGVGWYDSAYRMRWVNKYYSHLPKISYQEWKELVLNKKKFDYTKSREDIFYKIIYPLFPKEFLFGISLEEFLVLVGDTFILNDNQVDIIQQRWKDKENILV